MNFLQVYEITNCCYAVIQLEERMVNYTNKRIHRVLYFNGKEIFVFFMKYHSDQEFLIYPLLLHVRSSFLVMPKFVARFGSTWFCLGQMTLHSITLRYYDC